MPNKRPDKRPQVSERGGALYELQAQTRAPQVLLAEDDPAMRLMIASALTRDGFEVFEAANGAELLEQIGALLFDPMLPLPLDLIITDVRMPMLSGLSVLASLRRFDWAIPVLVITAFGDEATHDEAERLGAAAVLDKPFDLNDLRTAALHFAGAR